MSYGLYSSKAPRLSMASCARSWSRMSVGLGVDAREDAAEGAVDRLRDSPRLTVMRKLVSMIAEKMR